MRTQLVGLDNQIVLANSIFNNENLMACFKTNPVLDEPVPFDSINTYFLQHAGKTVSEKETRNAQNIWGQIFAIADDENGNINLDGKKKQLERYNPYYLQFRTGGIFTDKFGNKLHIVSDDNVTSSTLLNRGYFGNDNEYDLEVFTVPAEYTGDGWKEKAIEWFAGNKGAYAGLGNIFNKHGFGAKKRDKALVIRLKRNVITLDGTLVRILGTVIAKAIGAIVGDTSGTTERIITSTANEVANFADNPSHKLNPALLVDLTKTLVPTIAEGDGSLVNYITDGYNVYNAIQNKNYSAIVNQLHVSDYHAKMTVNGENYIDTLLQNNDIQTILSLTNQGTFNQFNGTAQNYRNTKLPAEFALATTYPEYSGMMQNIDEHDITASPEFLNYMISTQGGGMSNLLPTTGLEDGQDMLVEVMKLDSSWKTDIRIHKAYLMHAVSMPAGQSAFDEKILIALEKQLLLGGNKKQVVLPAGIPATKAQCIAKELSTAGFTVITSDYQALRLGEFKPRSYEMQTPEKLYQLFKKRYFG